MQTETSEGLCGLLAALAGESAIAAQCSCACPAFPPTGLGYSQLNELLLLHCYDRVTQSFFQFLVNGKLEYEAGANLATIAQLEEGVERAKCLSLLVYGNVKFGFKKLARDENELNLRVTPAEPIPIEEFEKRHEHVIPIEPIPSEDTYYLGYIVDSELEQERASDPENPEVKRREQRLKQVREQGLRNQRAYLVSDHLDVYIATSMRRRHEYLEVGEFARRVFESKILRPLKLRWFDPTQAYCPERIDKGLSEALMLKRALCTLYLVQESDTLGKDSELASTLAQGKPVIAYIPFPTEKDVEADVERFSELYGQSQIRTILDRLADINPKLAWEKPEVRQWLDKPDAVDQGAALKLLVDVTQREYNKRASNLSETHPLGLQVHLDTGVANGVLVVRTIEHCAELVYRVVTGTLQFRIEERIINGLKYQLLREKISDSVFRVMTGDDILANSFWNFYLELNR